MGGVVKTQRRSDSLFRRTRSDLQRREFRGAFPPEKGNPCTFQICAQKKGAQTETFESRFFLVPPGRGLPHEGVGAKKFCMPLETREIKLFLAGYPGILPGYPGSARKVREKKVCVQFSSPKNTPSENPLSVVEAEGSYRPRSKNSII